MVRKFNLTMHQSIFEKNDSFNCSTKSEIQSKKAESSYQIRPRSNTVQKKKLSDAAIKDARADQYKGSKPY